MKMLVIIFFSHKLRATEIKYDFSTEFLFINLYAAELCDYNQSIT